VIAATAPPIGGFSGEGKALQGWGSPTQPYTLGEPLPGRRRAVKPRSPKGRGVSRAGLTARRRAGPLEDSAQDDALPISGDLRRRGATESS
jgi:hypothetical protein